MQPLTRRRFIVFFCIGIGIFLIVTAFQQVNAQGGDDDTPPETSTEATFAGLRDCLSCHRGLSREHQESMHGRAAQDVGRRFEEIIGDLEAESDVLVLQLPDEDEPRKLTGRDIAMTVGAGRYVQRYLYEIERGEFILLPIEWNAVEEQWQPFELAETWPDPAYDWLNNCAGCHTTGLDVETGEWVDAGVQCESCHGPGSIHVELAEAAPDEPDEETRRAMRDAVLISSDAQICGQCHSRGTDIATDLPYPTGFIAGESVLAEIFEFHATANPVHWWASGHARQINMQYNEWLLSSHGQSLESVLATDYAEDSCLTCHSADYLYAQNQLTGEEPDELVTPITLDNAEFGITCTACHNPHNYEAELNLVNEPLALCVDCHSNGVETGVHHPSHEMFTGETLITDIDGIASAHAAAEDGPDCLSCHMPELPMDEEESTRHSHSFHPIAPSEAEADQPGSCMDCHSDSDAASAQAFINDIQNLNQLRLETVNAALTDDAPDWVVDAINFAEGDGSLGIHNYRYTDALLDAVETELNLVEEPEPATAVPNTPVNTNVTIGEDTTEEEELAPVSIAIMVISVLMIAAAGYAFFFRTGDAS